MAPHLIIIEATGCHTQFSAVILTIALLSVAPPRFARGTVLVARRSTKFDSLCKASGELSADAIGKVGKDRQVPASDVFSGISVSFSKISNVLFPS